MKIAICLFGHIRTYDECYNSLIQHVLSLYDCDVFMHTWSTIEHNTQTWHNDCIKNNISIFSKKEELINIYNLKDIIIEEQEDKSDEYGNLLVSFSGFNEPKKQSIWGTRCLYTSITKVYQLAKKYQEINNINYDYILFIRPDILIYNDFKIDKFIEDLREDELNKSFFFTSLVQCNTRTNDIRKMHANDLMFFAKSQVIDNIVNHFEDFLSIFHDGLYIQGMALETYKLEMIKNLGYINWRIDYHMFKDYDIKRRIQINDIPNDISPKVEEITTVQTKETHFNKHLKRLKQNLHSIISLPIELISTIYYAAINK